MSAIPTTLSPMDQMLELKTAALSSFKKQGLPTRASEEYKYTQPGNRFQLEQVGHNLPPLPADQEIAAIIAEQKIPALGATTLFFFNGNYYPSHSELSALPESVICLPLSECFSKHPELVVNYFSKYASIHADPFIALNTLLPSNGLFIYIPEGITITAPIQFIHVFSAIEATTIQPRHTVVVGKGSKVNIVETTCVKEGATTLSVNALTELVLEPAAELEYTQIQHPHSHPVGSSRPENELNKFAQLTTTQILQAEASKVKVHTLTLSGSWMRNNLNVVVAGSHCETLINGLFHSTGDQHIDNHTLINHAKPHCNSTQLYKGILDKKSTGVFNGKIVVARDAQKINAYQSSKNILVSDDATINTKPQLEIYADDVKCSHGTTTGQLDEEALFYLRSRGIGQENARRLLLLAFAAEVLQTVTPPALKEHLNQQLQQQLQYFVE